MGVLADLKGKISTDFYEDAADLLDIYIYNRFDYLRIRTSSWENLFVKTIEMMMEENLDSTELSGELCRLVNLGVKRHIQASLKNGDITLCNNLLMKLKSKFKMGLILRHFVYEFEQLGISFMDEVYDLLKEKSPAFDTILEQLQVSNLTKKEFEEFLNKTYQMGIGSEKNKYTSSFKFAPELVEKYSNFTFDEIKDMCGDTFQNLSSEDVRLLERYFSTPPDTYLAIPYHAEKEINLLSYDYNRKSTSLSLELLKNVYLENKEKFKPEEILYLECFVFKMEQQSKFYKKYPDGTTIIKAQLINKLEMLYYGIEDLFDASLSKEQYVSVLEKYPDEIEASIKDMLDDYYGIYQAPLSIQDISKKYGMSYDEAKEILRKSKKLCLSLYSNLNNSQKIDFTPYIPYVLDKKYPLNEDVRNALKLYFEGFNYEEIEKRMGKKGAKDFISKGIQKIDAYRFGVEKVKTKVEDLAIEISDEDILLEIERHPSESVITEEEKTFLCYYLGIKSKYNPEQQQLSGQKLQQKLNFKRNVPARYRDILDKIKQRKMGNLEPEFIIIPREKLSSILKDPHLPITEEDRLIICSILEINGYSIKTLTELAEELKVTVASIRRKYQIAIININKYLIGEKEGIIDYNTDIVPNLRYFTSTERLLIEEYYVHHLTNKEISKKYNLSIGKTTRLMYRLKTSLNEFIQNPEGLKFDYEYYRNVVDSPDFPFRGNLEQAKKIFDLYVGESTFGRMEVKEIKKTLGLDMQPITISRMIDSLVLSTFKYRDGIRKENSFTVRDVQDYYQTNKSTLSRKALQLIEQFLTKDYGIDMRMDDDLTYLLLRKKYPNYFRIDASKKKSLTVFKKYHNQLSKKARGSFMAYTGITERDLMSSKEKQQVLVFISMLDVMLRSKPTQK